MVVLYRIGNDARSPVRAAELSLNQDGQVEISVIEPSHVTESLVEGQPSRELKRMVSVDEGELYIRTLKERMAGATYWYVSDE